MKVLIITLIPSPHLYEIHNTFAHHPDVELEMFYELKKSPRRDWGEYIPDCKHTILKSKQLLGISSLVDFKLNEYLEKTDADIVVIGSSPWSPNTWIVKQWAQRHAIPYVVFSEPPNLTRSSFNKLIKKMVGKKLLYGAAGFVGVTKKTCEIIAELYDLKKSSFVLPYYSDLSQFTSIPLRSSRNEVTKFLFLGEITYQKRLDLMIDALSKIEKPFELNIVGAGELREEMGLRSQTISSGTVIFHGKVPYAEVHSILKNTDFLILPSEHDGFGMVVVEALAAGVPIIASESVMSAVEFVENGKNGWLFKQGSVEELENKIDLAINSKSNWSQMSINARESLKEYDAQKLSNAFYTFLEGLI
jgi:glycosyltransferase involved in cell wall biosynthesis